MGTTIRRAGLSLRVSAANAVAAVEPPAVGVVGNTEEEHVVRAAHGDGSSVALGSMGSRARVRRLVYLVLKPPARLVFRALRPIARPILFRLRRYLSEPIHRQITGESDRVLAHLVHHTEVLHHAVLDEVRTSMLDEVRASASLTMRRVDGLALETRREMAELRAHVASLAARAEELSMLRPIVEDGISEMAQQRLTIEASASYAGAAARRVAIADGEGRVMVRTMVGYVVVSATDHALVAALLETGELEKGTRIVIERTLRPGDVFVDVGANVGLHSIAAGRKVGPDGRVLAFEPFPPTVALLERSIWMNELSDVTQVFPVGVSNTVGTSELFLGGTSGHHSLFPLDGSEGADKQSVTVPIMTLDEALGSQARVDLLKVDAEGAELEVLEGAARVLKGNPEAAIIVELGTSHLRRTHTQLADWLGRFAELGYTPFAIDEQSGDLAPVESASLEGVYSVNLFFAPSRGRALERATS